MLLSSSVYFVFLIAIFLLYWPLARFRAASLAVLLLANYFFYAKWGAVLPGLDPDGVFRGLPDRTGIGHGEGAVETAGAGEPERADEPGDPGVI